MIPAYYHDAPLFVKMGVNIMMSSARSRPFVKTTIYKYLWNISDPILDIAYRIAPSLVPTKNVGMLSKVSTGALAR